MGNPWLMKLGTKYVQSSTRDIVILQRNHNLGFYRAFVTSNPPGSAHQLNYFAVSAKSPILPHPLGTLSPGSSLIHPINHIKHPKTPLMMAAAGRKRRTALFRPALPLVVYLTLLGAAITGEQTV